MNQNEVNAQIFAHLTFQKALLEQITCFMLSGFQDKGELFIKQFIDSIAYNMSTNPAMSKDASIDVLQLQSDSIRAAEMFFERVRKNIGTA